MGGRKRNRKVWILGWLLGGALWGAGAGAQGTPPTMSGAGFGTEWVSPDIFFAGPVFTDCGKGKLPFAGGTTIQAGCPSALIVVPGHYRPVPKKGWKLAGSERRHLLFLTYECLVHWVLGVIPLPISKECVGPTGMKNLEDYVLSWWAYPLGWETPRAVREPR